MSSAELAASLIVYLSFDLCTHYTAVTVVLIFYQKHITGFPLAEHLQQFKTITSYSSAYFYRDDILYVAAVLYTLHLTFPAKKNVTLPYSISQSGSEVLSPLLSLVPKQKGLF